MPEFRKKPVVIEAFQLPPNGSVPAFIADAMDAGTISMFENGTVDIHTLEGTMRADLGDWIIQDVKGELYPCKPDIFAATYDPV